MKTKKVTFNMIAVGVEDSPCTELVVSDDITVEVKHRLDFKEAIQFAQNIVSICFDDDDTDYYPEVFDAAVRISTLMSYAGVDAPKDFNKAFNVVYGTPLFDRIMAVIDANQWGVLVEGAKRKIAFKRNLIESNVAVKVNDLLARIDAVTKESEKLMEGVDADDLLKSMDEIVKGYGKQVEQAAKLKEDDEILVISGDEIKE